MSVPIVVLTAEAGSGKDSLGAHAAAKLGGVTIGFADPLKQMARDFFGFDDDQLYGPSESRNKVDTRFDPSYQKGELLGDAMSRTQGETGRRWCRTLFPNDPTAAHQALVRWMVACQNQALQARGLSPRFVLQTLGTEWGRTLDPEVWVKNAMRTGMALLGGGNTYTRKGGLVKDATQLPYNVVLVTDGRFPNETVLCRAMGALAVQVIRPGKEDTTTTGVAGHASEALLKTIPAHFFDAVIVNNGSLEALHGAGLQVLEGLVGMNSGQAFERICSTARYDHEIAIFGPRT